MIKLNEVEKHFKRDHLTRPLIKYFYYPITIFSSWIFVNLKIHENVVTLFSLVLAMIASIMYYYLGGVWLVLAGFLFALGVMIDLADGTVARYYGRGSVLGLWFDEVVGFMSFVVMFFVVMLKTLTETGDLTIVWLGTYTIFSYMMINYAALFSQHMRERHKLENPADKLRKKASKTFFGIVNPGAFAFSLDVQWTLVGLGVALNAPYFLFISFSVISTIQWASRFVIFYGK